MNAFVHEPRKGMTPKQRAAIFARRGGTCGDPRLGDANWGCGRKLRPGDRWRVEHSQALENGGTDDDENKWISCEWCWPAKDAADHGKAAKSRDVYTKHVVPRDGRKRGGFKGWRRFNGAPVWRASRASDD